MGTLRQLHGLSGFTKRSESEYDCFGAGHSSTSISAALGMSVGKRMMNRPTNNCIAVIGDGAITGGKRSCTVLYFENSITPFTKLIVTYDMYLLSLNW